MIPVWNGQTLLIVLVDKLVPAQEYAALFAPPKPALSWAIPAVLLLMAAVEL